MWYFVSCGSVRYLPSSVMVLYSKPLHPLALFLVSHMVVGFMAFLNSIWLFIYFFLDSSLSVLFRLHASSNYLFAFFAFLRAFISSLVTLLTLSVLTFFLLLFASVCLLFFSRLLHIFLRLFAAYFCFLLSCWILSSRPCFLVPHRSEGGFSGVVDFDGHK